MSVGFGRKRRLLNGISINTDCTNNVIEGNYIGTDLTGTLARGNSVGVLFCVTRDDVQVSRIAGSDRLRPRSQRLREVIESPDIEAAGPAESLARALLAEWPEAVRQTLHRAGHVLFCPDGTWHEFPASIAEPSWSVSRAPAASVLADLRTRIAEGQSLPGGELAELREDPERKGLAEER